MAKKIKLKLTKDQFKTEWSKFIANLVHENKPVAVELMLVGSMIGADFWEYLLEHFEVKPKLDAETAVENKEG